MKAIFIISAILVARMILAADSPSQEIVSARARYEAALAAAAKPVRGKYLTELQQIKDRALAQKNLKLALAADEEIKALNASVSTPNGGSLEERLLNTTWSWNIPKFTVTFLPEGKANVDKNAIFTWAVAKSSKPVVEVRWFYDGENRSAKFTFAQDLKSAKAVLNHGEVEVSEWESKPVEKK
jgi:hypothetical protein